MDIEIYINDYPVNGLHAKNNVCKAVIHHNSFGNRNISGRSTTRITQLFMLIRNFGGHLYILPGAK